MPKVLVVENDDTNAALFRELLEARGCLVDVAGSVEDAAERLAAGPPELIVIGLVIRRAFAIAPATRLQREARGLGIPVMVVSSLPVQSHHRTIMESGCDIYLAKPMTVRTFNAAVDRLLAEREHASPMASKLARVLDAAPPGDARP